MERDKALEMAMGQIEKQFGKGAIMRMGENLDMQIEAISTGTLSLDIALGIGGLPRGRGRRDLQARSQVWEIHSSYACRGGGPTQRRDLCLHRRRARHGPGVRRRHRGR